MNVSCIFRGRAVHIVDIDPSQSSGYFYVTWTDDILQTVNISRIDVTELTGIASGVSDTGSAQLLEYGADLYDEFHHETYIFPEDTNETVIFTAGGVNNTWSNWTEIVDNNAVTFSSKLALVDGHITSINEEACSAADKVYMVELSYGASHTIITRGRVESPRVNTGFSNFANVRSTAIPAGETVYYRCKCETGGATMNVHFRYHYHA